MGLEDNYRIVEVLGTGAMATVSKAVQKSLDRFVAIKQIRPHLCSDSQYVARFEREAKAVAALKHMNIVDVIDFGSEGGGYYLVIEFIDGPALEEVMAARRDVPLDVVLSTTVQVLNGLEYAHNHGVIHRDVKPANVMFNSSGIAKITDFGIAQDQDRPSLTQPGQALGTPSYMAPEQAQGLRVDQRADLFAVGVVLYRMLTGALPFPGKNVASVFARLIHDPPIPARTRRPDVPERLVAVLDRALAKDPSDRYFDAAEFVYELESFAFEARIQTGTRLVRDYLAGLNLVQDPRSTSVTGIRRALGTREATAAKETPRPTMGILPLTGCFGCQVNLLDLHQDLLALRDMFDIRFTHLMDVKDPPAVDVGLVEGSVANASDERRVRTFRERCRTLVALGTCASFGGLPGLRNLYAREEVLDRSYGKSASSDNGGPLPDPRHVPEIHRLVRPVSAVVEVDLEIPGCPSPHEVLMPALESISRGETPPRHTHNLCHECPRKHREMLVPQREYISGKVSSVMELPEIDPEVCFLEQGVLCMGMVTRVGCRARCVRQNIPCRGCMGPAPQVRETGAKLVNALASLLPVGSTRFRQDLVGLGYRYTLPVSMIPGNHP